MTTGKSEAIGSAAEAAIVSLGQEEMCHENETKGAERESFASSTAIHLEVLSTLHGERGMRKSRETCKTGNPARGAQREKRLLDVNLK